MRVWCLYKTVFVINYLGRHHSIPLYTNSISHNIKTLSFHSILSIHLHMALHMHTYSLHPPHPSHISLASVDTLNQLKQPRVKAFYPELKPAAFLFGKHFLPELQQIDKIGASRAHSVRTWRLLL